MDLGWLVVIGNPRYSLKLVAMGMFRDLEMVWLSVELTLLAKNNFDLRKLIR